MKAVTYLRHWENKLVQHNVYNKYKTTINAVFGALFFVAGAYFCIGPDRWHSDSSTFYYLNLLPPFWYMAGGLFIIAALLVWFRKGRPGAYFIGCCIYASLAVGSFLSAFGHWQPLPKFAQLPNEVPAGSLFATVSFTALAFCLLIIMLEAVRDIVDPERKQLCQDE